MRYFVDGTASDGTLAWIGGQPTRAPYFIFDKQRQAWLGLRFRSRLLACVQCALLRRHVVEVTQ